jgi:SAM-dependent methyltransferase
MRSDDTAPSAATIAQVGAFYDRHAYPPPKDDVDAYRRRWDDERRRADSHLLWPAQQYRDDRSILVAGCGTSQAAHYAVRWPNAKVVGIDVSSSALAFEDALKRAHELDNLELHELEIERVGRLGRSFSQVVCTGVLHHLPDPQAGLRALRDVLNPEGAMHLMVYAPYGRAGVYMLQDYCRRLGIGATENEIDDLAETMRELPPDHPLRPLLQTSPDFADRAGLADALLNPQDRAYSVPQLFDLLKDAGLEFGRWMRQAPYLSSCGALASTPHAQLLTKLAAEDQYAAVELFRGTMVRHSLIAHHASDRGSPSTVDFDGDAWLGYIPIRVTETMTVRERLPAGAAAVLINRNHMYRDLYLPINEVEDQLLSGIDGQRTIGEIGRDFPNRATVNSFFRKLWSWDQAIFDASNASKVSH